MCVCVCVCAGMLYVLVCVVFVCWHFPSRTTGSWGLRLAMAAKIVIEKNIVLAKFGFRILLFLWVGVLILFWLVMLGS